MKKNNCNIGSKSVEAGTLAILKDCLSYLSALAEQNEYRIVAIVYKKN